MYGQYIKSTGGDITGTLDAMVPEEDMDPNYGQILLPDDYWYHRWFVDITQNPPVLVKKDT